MFSSSVTEHTTAAVLTPTGRGAVATVCVRGKLSLLDSVAPPIFRAINKKKFTEQSIGRIAFGKWGLVQESAEDIVVCRIEPSVMEIHCHGGDAAVQRILDDLKQAGCQIVDWQDQLKMSVDFLHAECTRELSRASTWRTAEILHEQSSGILRDAFSELRRDCERLTALTSESINCPTELDSVRSHLIDRIASLIKWSNFGCHLSQPWNVVLTGRPNVGKSSLINALLGYERAIVFDQPGTTRDVLTAETALDGWPITLADTAGLRETSDELEAAGVMMAQRRLESADVRLVLIDLSADPTSDDLQLLQQWPDAIVVAHKCDLSDCWGSQLPSNALRVSSVNRTGIEELKNELSRRLVPEVPTVGTPVPISILQTELLKRLLEQVRSDSFADTFRTIDELFAGSTTNESDQSDRVS